MTAFLINGFVSLFFIGGGVFCLVHNFKRSFSLWTVQDAIPVKEKDLKKYTTAVGKLIFAYGVIMLVLGLLLLGGQNSAGVVFYILGVSWSSIGMMIVYTRIEAKYRIK